MRFKVKDWCFSEYELKQIKKMDGTEVIEVSDGTCSMSGHYLTDRCRPLNMKIKRISDSVKYWSDRFHALKNNALNHPDLHRELVRRWCELCDNKENDNVSEKLWDSLNKFAHAVIDNVDDLHFKEIEGIRLFRQ